MCTGEETVAVELIRKRTKIFQITFLISVYTMIPWDSLNEKEKER